MGPFRRLLRKFTFPSPEPARNVVASTRRPPARLEDVSEYLQQRMVRMNDLVGRRSRTWREDIPAIDEEMDQLCREVAEDLENSGNSKSTLPELSTRLRRMVRLTLEEMTEQRDKARQERRVDG